MLERRSIVCSACGYPVDVIEYGDTWSPGGVEYVESGTYGSETVILRQCPSCGTELTVRSTNTPVQANTDDGF